MPWPNIICCCKTNAEVHISYAHRQRLMLLHGYRMQGSSRQGSADTHFSECLLGTLVSGSCLARLLLRTVLFLALLERSRHFLLDSQDHSVRRLIIRFSSSLRVGGMAPGPLERALKAQYSQGKGWRVKAAWVTAPAKASMAKPE